MQHMLTVAEPVRRTRPEVPRSVAAVLERMIAKNPDDRFAAAAEVAEALDSLARGKTTQEIPRPRPLYVVELELPGGQRDQFADEPGSRRTDGRQQVRKRQKLAVVLWRRVGKALWKLIGET